MKIIKGNNEDYMLKIHSDAYTWFDRVEFDMSPFGNISLYEGNTRVLFISGETAKEFCRQWRLL